MASTARATTSAPTWRGAATTPAGGAKARSSSSSTATAEFPTICGTGTEDYFCGAYNFDIGICEPDQPHAYTEFTTAYAGLLPGASGPTASTARSSASACTAGTSWTRCASTSELRVTIQALGWRPDRERRYLPLQDDIASVAFWYQTLPHAPLQALPDRDFLEVI